MSVFNVMHDASMTLIALGVMCWLIWSGFVLYFAYLIELMEKKVFKLGSKFKDWRSIPSFVILCSNFSSKR